MKKTRILIVDDHALLRMGLKTYIASKKDLECVGEADNGLTAVELARKLKPDVVVMDLMMPELSGAEATRRIHEENASVRILILTSFGTSEELSAALANGATGAILKDAPTESILAAIRTISNGGKVLPATTAALTGLGARPKLSSRQREILQSIARGLTNDEIGRQFGIAGETVKKHLSILFAKLGVANRTEATALAIHKQLVKM